MAETNDFELFIGLILARLYEARPQRLSFTAEDFCAPIDDSGRFDDEKVSNWSNTMFWLREEGYIRDKGLFSGESSWTFAETELTEKGFRALNSLPAQLKGSAPQKSFGGQLVDLGKKTGWKAASKISEQGLNEGSKQASHAIGELIRTWFT